MTAAGDDIAPDSDVVEHSPIRYAMDGEVGADTLILIGSSDHAGGSARFSNRFSGAITAYAPGEDIVVIDHDGGYDVHSGTWILVALVSGIIAHWHARPFMAAKLSKGGTLPGDFTKKVKELMKEAAAYATDPNSDIKSESSIPSMPFLGSSG
ncbi:hypothetical protein B0T14DRAFT_149493 [Immersiella caudata]|uniref:Uncharacterized protein n=1 Tax=Immersiella caudata TaxID=314043 RepID=A0AA40C236_9PEZI|nr:hypothetical protein B0T14DRAFT_149493 [Immersiella caudata]